MLQNKNKRLFKYTVSVISNDPLKNLVNIFVFLGLKGFNLIINPAVEWASQFFYGTVVNRALSS